MNNKRKSLRFGLMINGLTVEQWQYDTIKILMDNGMKLSLIIQKKDKSINDSFLDTIKNKLLRHLTYKLWNRFLFHPRSKFSANIERLTDETPTIFCTPIIKNSVAYFKEIDIQEIRNQNLDFILQLGFDFVAGEVINTTKYGIWRFNQGDSFWTFLKGDFYNIISLQRLSGSEDKEIFLKSIKLKTTLHSYKAHLEQIHFACTTLPIHVCKEILRNNKTKEIITNTETTSEHIPNNFNMIQYYVKSVWRRVAFHLNDLFRQEDWNVGYCECQIHDFISKKENIDIQWFKKPRRNCYFADPFIIKTQKDTYIFFEWYSYPRGKADLAVAKKSEDFKIYHKITEFKEHRSYPFIFDYENVIYCMPESNQTNKVTLYSFDEDKLTLKEECVLLEGFPIVDATLYRHEDKWFMFLVNQKKSHTHLEIYYSDNLRGPYLPHDNNPVTIDCSKARPAGKIFCHQGKIIRPAQNCTEHYGQSITLEEIDLLTETEYSARDVGHIYPVKDSDYNKGIHTINSTDGMTVFDGKRFVFTLSGFKQQLKQKIHK